MSQGKNENEASILNLIKDFLSVDFLSRASDTHPDIYQFSFMAFRFDSNESTLRLVSLNLFSLAVSPKYSCFNFYLRPAS